MKFIPKTLLILTLSLLVAVFAKADIFDDIVSELKARNTTALTKRMNETIELRILDKQSVYSANQGVMIINEFLKKHQATSLEVLHRGKSKMGASYAICEMNTSGGKYRIVIYLRQVNGQNQIVEMSFDEDN